jgi:S-adenosyl-L-methionine hydrolase (adenosine-forming)
VTWVSFLTDYGLADGFVAACHGVIASALPDARIIDISHLVPPGDIRRGAAVLAQTVGYLPAGVHLAVVDPGVGTARRGIAVRAERGWLVGPDNGLLVPAAEELGGPVAAYALTVAPGTPATFHGRDVFAPAAARLAAGGQPGTLGDLFDPAGLVRLPRARARLVDQADLGGPAAVDSVDSTGGGGVAGTGLAVETEVTLVDHFGNVQLAARPELLVRAGLAPGAVASLVPAGGAPGAGVGRPGAAAPTSVPTATPVLFGVTFGSVAVGELVLYVDSAGLVALAVNGGRAADRLGLAAGDLVVIGAARTAPSA